MSSQSESSDRQAQWRAWAESMNELNDRFADAFEENVDAQLRFAETWMDSVEEVAGPEELDEGMESVFRAYEIWMGAAHDTFELVNDSLEGEDVQVERFRDTWLNAANQAFKEVMRSAAFSAVTGRSIGDLLDLRRQMDEATESMLRDLGIPTRGDVVEVGERLVELERRNHAVEQRLDEVSDALEQRIRTVERKLDEVSDAQEQRSNAVEQRLDEVLDAVERRNTDVERKLDEVLDAQETEE